MTISRYVLGPPSSHHRILLRISRLPACTDSSLRRTQTFPSPSLPLKQHPTSHSRPRPFPTRSAVLRERERCMSDERRGWVRLWKLMLPLWRRSVYPSSLLSFRVSGLTLQDRSETRDSNKTKSSSINSSPLGKRPSPPVSRSRTRHGEMSRLRDWNWTRRGLRESRGLSFSVSGRRADVGVGTG
jgi:hypothetical protein